MSQPLLQRLAELDDELQAGLQVKADEFDDVAFTRKLSERAALLQQIQTEGNVTEQQVQEIIQRSRVLTSSAEAVKHKLGEQLKVIQKGRRSQQAYQSVKYQE
ncbi:hypothetical protein [Oceanimonas sp. CAM02]|uniref:hypothetical protein n=1 Tax=Oceanimonas sp. CAM02 TaxID=3080336 RepID=UPI002935ACB6|nr:hypothetical protein [Oceanimonas sp. CAM02]MDV2856436.1 hypothetical protein [Oceanimonas sp. CAM02]